MRTILIVLIVLAGCHDRGDGERCNPLQYSDDGVQGDCRDGLACVYATAPNCGVAYCCKLDEDGDVADEHPGCRPDPTLDQVCGLDLSTPLDGAEAPDGG